jgi:hypothetical protein
MKKRRLLYLLALLFSSANYSCYAQSVVRIEEDWELHVVQPDQNIDVPQITTGMLPFGDGSDVLFQCDINHGVTPAFSSGGWQLRITDEATHYSSTRLLPGVKLSNSAETITWTQVVQKASNGFYFGITHACSTSFGMQDASSEAIFVSNDSTGAVSLNDYDAQHSLGNSEVSYAGNRVAWLRLKQIRLLYSNGQIAEYALNVDMDL